MLKLGVAQIASGPSKEENLEKLLGAIEKLAECDVVVMPECAMGVGGEGVTRGFVETVAEPLEGSFVSTLSRAARENSVAVIAGVYERREDAIYNSLVSISPSGSLAAVHRKILLFDAFEARESSVFSEGPLELTLLEARGLLMGLATCFEIRFPELFRAMALAGAEAFIVPAAWYRGLLKEDQWISLAKARALDNVSYLVGVGNAARFFVGRSLVVDPLGVVELDLGYDEKTACWRIDPQRVRKARKQLPLLGIAERKGLGQKLPYRIDRIL